MPLDTFGFSITHQTLAFYYVVFFIFSVTSVVKRSVDKGTFSTRDIYFPKPPERVNGEVSAEFTILKQDKNSITVSPISAQPIAALIEENRKKFEEELGVKVMGVSTKKDSVKPSNLPRTAPASGGMIAGIVIAVFIVVILAALAVWYFRYDCYCFVLFLCFLLLFLFFL